MSLVLVVDDSAVDQKIAGGLLETSSLLQVEYADSGTNALELINQRRPDVVVTDLQMPDLDGLQLVTELGQNHPDVPVVLMTAHGGENVAAESLAAGAASFVPKTMLSEHLLDTVLQILAISASEARYKKLNSCATKTDLEFSLLNDLDLVDPLIDMVQQVGLSHGLMTQRDRVQVGVALEAAINNAVVHGNLEMDRSEFPVASSAAVSERAERSEYADRRVYLKASITPETASFVIRDDGRGFDVSTVVEPNAQDGIASGSGRGLVLMQSLMDDVVFNEQGNEVTMTFRRN